MRIERQFSDDLADLIRRKGVVFNRADVRQHAAIRAAQQRDRRLVERDTGGIDMIISAEGKEFPLLRIEQGVPNAVAPTQGGNDADLVDTLAALLRQGVERLGDDLRGQAGHTQENLTWRVRRGLRCHRLAPTFVSGMYRL